MEGDEPANAAGPAAAIDVLGRSWCDAIVCPAVTPEYLPGPRALLDQDAAPVMVHT
jgi:hypothetical protein